MEPAIDVRDLEKTYAKGVVALRGISFTVEPGTVFALLGPNGAGKSSTLRILTTLSLATAGRARVAGLDVAEDADGVRRRIGCVAQANGVDIYSTGSENVRLQGRLHGLDRATARQRADELLGAFGLADAADRLVKGWSGGMKRRLDVAMGLVHRPQVLFLDEPTTGLDPESRATLWEEVERRSREGLTIFLTTHYLEEADRLAGRVAILDQGRIVAEGTPEGLKGELRGDLVAIRLVEPERAGDAVPLLGAQEGVASVARDAEHLFVRVDRGARSIPGLVAALGAAGLTVAEVSASRPSLDDVYLQATGHRFPGEAEPAARMAGGA